MPGFRAYLALLFVVFTSLVLAAPQCRAQAHHVLLINSYHSGLTWTDNVTDGIERGLLDPSLDTQLHIEYLHAKCQFTRDAEDLMVDLFSQRYAMIPFTAVIAADEEALQFSLRHRAELFPGVPIVFCGVTWLDPDLQAQTKRLTGVVEERDYVASLEMALKIWPSAEKIYSINDMTSTGLIVARELRGAVSELSRKIELIEYNGLELQELTNLLAKVDPKDIVYLGSFSLDGSGAVYNSSSVAYTVANASPSPVFVESTHVIDTGVVGGMVTDGRQHGHHAAKIVQKLIEGGDPDNLTPIEQGRQAILFDYDVLRHFGIDEKVLPPETVFVNREQSFYVRNKEVLWRAAIVIAFLLGVIVFLALTIQQRRKAELALRASEKLYRNLVDYSPLPIMAHRNGKFIYLNPAALLLFGARRPEDMIDLPFFEIIHPDDRSCLDFQRAGQFSNAIEVRHIEVRAITLSGRQRDIETTTMSVEIGGEPAWLTICIDITGRKQAIEALSESEYKYRNLVELMNEGVFTVDENLLINYVNDRFCEILNMSRESLIGSTFNDYIPEELFQEQTRRLAARREGDRTPYDLQFYRGGGEEHVYVHISPTPLFDKDGSFKGSFAVVADITEEMRLKERIGRAEKMESLGRLAGGVAHDLNNILSSLVGYPDLLLMKLPGDSDMRGPLETIKQSGQRAADIVRDLLTLARRGVRIRRVVNINDIVREYTASQEYLALCANHPEIECNVEIDSQLGWVEASPIHLSKSLMNLTVNAFEAINDDGHCSIRTRSVRLSRPMQGYQIVAPGAYAVLSVEDSGHGIAAADLQHMFEPFYTRKVMGRSGTGLGLTVVWGTVDDHEGFIDVVSNEGEGTRIDLYFPLTMRTPEAASRKEKAETLRGDGERILIVDDIEQQRSLGSAILSSLGYKPESVASGEEALQWLKANEADLVILDMIMEPGIDGLETYEGIVRMRPEQPTIITSGYAETDRVRRAMTLGVAAFVQKPYDIKQIAEVIHKVLRNAG